MAYVSYTPTGLFTKAMFDFSPYPNYLFSGIINVSVSDGFSNYDYALGLINSSNYTMNPYSNEIFWSQQVKDNIKSTLNVISSFANIVFSQVIDYDTSGFGAYSIASPADVGIYSDINISYMNSNSTSLLGISSGATDLFGYLGSRGDVLINVTGSAFTQEGVTFDDYSKSRQVLLHELGHSLGLSHPFSTPNQIKSNYSSLINAGFDKLGFNMANTSFINKEYFSIMSYDDQSNIINNNAFTPMIFDVIALVNAYGEGVGTTGAGNDTINAGNRGYRTYFDKDGIDTVNLSLYSSGVYFNMGVVITDATHLVGVAMSLVDAQQTIVDGGNPAALRWFYGEYENALGSVSSDVLIGNSLGNNIDAGSGDDIILGSGGNDVLNGGIGQDVAKYNLNRDKYIITSSVGFYTVSSVSGEEGSDTLISIESLSFADITGGIGGFIDTTPPNVSTFSPADEAAAVTISANIVVTFNETIQRGSGYIILKTDSGATVATYAQSSSNVTISGSTLTINPTADLNYSTGYKVEFAVGSVKDTNGNNYAGITTYNFTTSAAPDSTPPTVSIFSPADEALSVSIDSNIVVTFNEVIQRGAGDIVLKTNSGSTVATYSQASSNVTISGSTLTINPSADLNYSTGYKVEFAAGSVKDTAGNNFAGTTTYNFTTQNDRALSLFNFENISKTGSVLSADIIGLWPSNIKNFSFSLSCLGVDYSKFESQYGDLNYNWNLYNNSLSISGSTFTTPPRLISGDVNIGRVFFNSKSDGFKNISIGVSGYVTNSSDIKTSFTSLPNFLSLNNPPVVVSTNYGVLEDSYLTSPLTAKDFDIDATSLSFSILNNPSNGNVTVSTNGTFTYTPNANFNGSDSFTFKANDGALDSAAATVSITVSAVNDSPVGTIDITGTAKQGETLTATKNFTDVDGIPVVGTLFKTSWLADGTAITGTSIAVSQTGGFIASNLVLTPELVGKKLSFTATYTDNGGTQETVTSAQTVAVVEKSNPAVPKFWKEANKTPSDTKKSDAVNLTDAIAILKMIVGLNVNSNNTPLSPYQAIAADFDQSGDVGLTDAIGVLKMVVGLSAPTPTWKYYDDTKLASAYTSAQSLNPKGWTSNAVITDTPIGTPDILIDSSVKLIGVLTGDVDGSWTGV